VSGTASNVRFWVGTSDDWIGETDEPTSSLGLVTGEGSSAMFAPKCDGPTNAVLVESGDEFLMLYSPDVANVQAVLSTQINTFDSSVNIDDDFSYEDESIEGEPELVANLPIIDQNPLDSTYRSEDNDGAHAIAIAFGDVGTTPVTRTWYYQAGELPEVPFSSCPDPQLQVFRPAGGTDPEPEETEETEVSEEPEESEESESPVNTPTRVPAGEGSPVTPPLLFVAALGALGAAVAVRLRSAAVRG
jgi:hypothetical protein